MKPEFVDNRNGNTLVAALRGHLDWLAETYAQLKTTLKHFRRWRAAIALSYTVG